MVTTQAYGTPTVQLAPLKYHRLSFADVRYSAWRQVLEGLTSATLYLIGFAALTAVQIPDESLPAPFSEGCGSWLTSQGTGCLLLWGAAGAAVWLPAALLARFLWGPSPFGLIWSVAGRLRWHLLLRYLTLTLAIFLFIEGSRVLFAVIVGLQVRVEFGVSAVTTFGLSLMLLPLQVTAEEFVFRGYLLQAIGRWFGRPIVAVVVAAPVFVVGHLSDVRTAVSSALMALVAGYLCIRTGGLEAAIALHLANNLTIHVSLLLVPDRGLGPFLSNWSGAATHAVSMALVCVVISHRVREVESRLAKPT